MHRRHYLAALSGVVGTSRVGSAAASRGGGGSRDRTGALDDGISRSDWEIDYTLEVERDGRATFEMTVQGDAVPSEIRLGDHEAEIRGRLAGENAIHDRDGRLVWVPNDGNTVGFDLQLGSYEAGNVVAGVYDEAVFTAVDELVPPTSWSGGFDALPRQHRFTISPPSGWNVAFSGERVGTNTYEVNPRVILAQYPREVIPVGNFEVHAREVSETEIRAVSLPPADGVDPLDALDLWVDGVPALERHYQPAAYPKLGVIVPAPEGRRGGQGRDHTFVVTDNLPLLDVEDRTLSTVFGELGRTFQRHDRPRWYLDGSHYWVLRLAMLEAGRITEPELYRNLRIAGTEAGLEVGEPYEVPATETRWKALAVLAALDADLRARTDGEAAFPDLLALTHNPLADGSMTVQRETMLAALAELAGIDYTGFFERFVDGSAYPDVVLTDGFSISEPSTIDFGAALEYAAVDVSPEAVDPGESVTVTATLGNAGSEAGSFTVRLTVDGDVVETVDRSLAPGERTDVAFEPTFSGAGSYELALDHLSLGTVSVGTPATPTTTDTRTAGGDPASPDGATDGDGSGPGVVGCLAGAGAAWTVLRSRRLPGRSDRE